MEKQYILKILGCDNSTIFSLNLNQEQFDKLKKSSIVSKRDTKYICMPIIEIEEK